MKWINVKDLEGGMDLAREFCHTWDGILFDLSAIKGGIEGTLKLMSDRGGVLLNRIDGETVGFSGYTMGEPADDFSNPEICFVYLLLIVPEYQRQRRMIATFFRDWGTEAQEKGTRLVRFRAFRDDPYLHRIYEKTATPVGVQINDQGRECVLYEYEFKENRFPQKLGVVDTNV